MKKLQNFFLTALLGGLVVVLPVAILLFVFNWLFDTMLDGVAPLVALIFGESSRQDTLAGILVVLIILAVCFVIGLLVRTRIGKWVYSGVEDRLLKKAPGYSVIKETILQFTGKRKNPFASVALVNLYGNSTLVTAFVTDEHEDGRRTVFVPTGPNPTSGNIYHVEAQQVHPVAVSVEDTMRSIISCGAGSSSLVKALGGGDDGEGPGEA